jgi:hypothetical protein
MVSKSNWKKITNCRKYNSTTVQPWSLSCHGLIHSKTHDRKNQLLTKFSTQFPS